MSRIVDARLDDWVRNITSSVGSYDVAAVDSAFLQVFLWERFGCVAPRPGEFKPVVFIEEEVDGEEEDEEEASLVRREQRAVAPRKRKQIDPEFACSPKRIKVHAFDKHIFLSRCVPEPAKRVALALAGG